MEPHKRAKYSKSHDADEIDEVLMDKASDEELEERDEVRNLAYSRPHPQKMIPRIWNLRFGLQELWIRHMSLILLDLQMTSTD